MPSIDFKPLVFAAGLAVLASQAAAERQPGNVGDIFNVSRDALRDCKKLGDECGWLWSEIAGFGKRKISHKEVRTYSRAGGTVSAGDSCHTVQLQNAGKVNWPAQKSFCFGNEELTVPACKVVTLEKGFGYFKRRFERYKVIGVKSVGSGPNPKPLTVKIIESGTFWQFQAPYVDLINQRPIPGICK